jgi:hypothetical protein
MKQQKEPFSLVLNEWLVALESYLKPLEITSLSSVLQCSANGPYIQKHLLRIVLCCPFYRNEPITRVPSSLVAVRIRDDAATADVIRYSQNDLECFGDQCVPETPTAEPFVNGWPGQENQREIIGGKPRGYFFGNLSRGMLDVASVK